MANPERGGVLEIPGKQLNPAERIRRAKDALETGRNLGIALDLLGKLETLTQIAEANPGTSVSSGILEVFSTFEAKIKHLESLAGEEKLKEQNVIDAWVKYDVAPWVDQTFDAIKEGNIE